jgi:CubicO group peptidase (beta-lactamase class C family)
MINGHCDDRFNELYKIFSNQLSSGHELGCSVAIEYEGKEVVNLYGGYTNTSKSTEWKNNTLVNVWSVTKAVTGICITKIVNDGLLNIDKKVSYYVLAMIVNEYSLK